jgi:hypothetical protein
MPRTTTAAVPLDADTRARFRKLGITFETEDEDGLEICVERPLTEEAVDLLASVGSALAPYRFDLQEHDPESLARLSVFASKTVRVELNGWKFDDASESLAALPRLPKLVELEIRQSINDSGLACVGALKNLTKLWLFGVACTDKGLASLAKLAKLRRLTLMGHDKPTVAITARGTRLLAGLKQLCELSLYNLTDPKPDLLRPLAGLAKLAELSLDVTRFTPAAFEPLFDMPRLTTLSLQGANHDKKKVRPPAGLVRRLGQAAKIRDLWLHYEAAERGFAKELVELTRVENLTLAVGGLGDAVLDQLEPLKNLKCLKLYDVGLTERGLARLEGFTWLSELDLFDKAISSRQISAMERKRKRG